ncbi:MAG: Qat anti-phage system TatD family nuclease QatD [Gluconobacter sp.]|uniref:Qat anti-phage system TatD family nuclease QatD n=1 Tax=Gluconobacter sp. TaxID=1876758 RepID=UPI0039EBAE39
MADMNAVRPRLVDFHCHLDLYPDHEALIAECDREGVATLTVTTTPKAWPRNRDLAERSAHVRVALGLHPQLVAEREAEIALFERYLPEARYVGEVGLDAGPRFYASFEAQERVFERVLRASAEQGGKILTVHSVRSVGRVLGHIERSLPPDRGRVVLHWFTGTAAEARRAADLGCYFSINSEMTRSPKHGQLVAALPADRLLTETDGPFVQDGEKPVRPRAVWRAVREIAALRGVTEEETAALVIRNLRALVTAP